MKIPLSKRVFRDGMRRTRRLRLTWLAFILLIVIVSFISFIGENDGYRDFQEIICDFLYRNWAIFLGCVMILLGEGKLHGYHQSRRIADTIKTLPCTERERYWSYNLVLCVNALILTISYFVPAFIICTGKKNSGLFYRYEGVGVTTEFMVISYNGLVAMLLGGLIFVAVVCLSRELSHSHGLYIVWLIIICGITILLPELIGKYVKLKSNWIAEPDGIAYFLNRFTLEPCILGSFPENVFCSSLGALFIVVLLLFVGRLFNRRYSADYLENEKENKRIFHILLIVVDACALVLAYIMVFVVDWRSFWTTTCSIVFVPMIHFLICLFYKEKKVFHTIRYFAIGTIVAVVFWGGCFLAYKDYMNVPQVEDISFVSVFGGYKYESFLGYYGETDYIHTTSDIELVTMLRERILSSVAGEKVEWNNEDELAPQECQVTLYTKQSTRCYNIKLNLSEYEAVMNSSDKYFIGSTDEMKPSSVYLSDEEVEQFLNILREEPVVTIHVVENSFFGGRKVSEESIVIPMINEEDTSYVIPSIDYSESIYFGSISNSQPKAAAYIYSILETRYGWNVKTAIQGLLNRDSNADSIRLLTDVNHYGVNIGWNEGKITATYQINNLDRYVLENVEMSEEKTAEMLAILLKYCDGDGSIEEAETIRIYIPSQGYLTEETYKDYGRQNRSY